MTTGLYIAPVNSPMRCVMTRWHACDNKMMNNLCNELQARETPNSKASHDKSMKYPRANAEHGTPNYLDNLVAKPAKCASALAGNIKILALLSSNLGLTANSGPGAKKSDGSLSL